VISSNSDTTRSFSDIVFCGEASLVKMEGDTIRSFLAENASFLKNCQGKYLGFRSSEPLTLYLHKGKGHLYTEEEITLDLYYPGLESVFLGQEPANVVESKENHFRILVPEGSYEITLSASDPGSYTDPDPCQPDSTTTHATGRSKGLTPKILAWPNPAGDHFSLYLPENPNREMVVRINDLAGRKISQQRFSAISEETKEIRINCTHWPPGVYLVSVYSVSGNPGYFENLTIIVH
jgi:hypothetical protein